MCRVSNRNQTLKPYTYKSVGYSGMYSVCRVDPTLKPYLSYTITVRSTRLNTPKLSDYQIKLYQKICELRFDENLTWKQVADKLNKLGYGSFFSNVKSDISKIDCDKDTFFNDNGI